jgi:signal transduction histidine kinase
MTPLMMDPTGSPKPTPQLVLVVDDTPTNLEVISEALTDAGYEVATAISGDRALKQIQHTLPDLILLDVQMPGVDGFETCRRLKENPDTLDVPIIFMTALSDPDSKVKGFNLGAVDYITKPFQEKEVLARVSTHLKLRSLSRELEHQVRERTAELSATIDRLQQSQIQLIQSEKMSALGNLVAGIAHEINNPVGFIAGNLKPAREYIQDLFHVIGLYQANCRDLSEDVAATIDSIDLDYIQEDLPKLLTSLQEGTDRIRSISMSLRIFSRADQEHKVPFDIHEGLDSTILILKHRLKANKHRPAIEVTRDYGELPPIECFPGQLNQVFMNLLTNAIDALEQANQERSFEEIQACPNSILIQTQLINPTHVLIRIQDNGCGMSDELKQRIFDHLFTTKPVGQGTGLGLSIAHQIIVDKHHGRLEVNSAPKQGTEFLIQIPVKH